MLLPRQPSRALPISLLSRQTAPVSVPQINSNPLDLSGKRTALTCHKSPRVAGEAARTYSLLAPACRPPAMLPSKQVIMSCHRKVTHYRDGFGVKNKWTETCGLLSLLHLGLLFCHINIRTGPHYTPLPRCDGSAGSAPCTALGCAGEPHPGDMLPTALPPGTAQSHPSPIVPGGGE